MGQRGTKNKSHGLWLSMGGLLQQTSPIRDPRRKGGEKSKHLSLTAKDKNGILWEDGCRTYADDYLLVLGEHQKMLQ